MMENETVLLQRFARGADAEAFAELVRRHVRLVYAASWRVLKNQNDAMDVTQETFYDLMRQAGGVSGSLGGWLHRVATRKSIDVVQRRVRRRRREQIYAQTHPVEVRSWQQLSGHVDEAFEQLDPSTKSLLLAHFIAGKTTARIAREQGVSKATVSRYINAGLEQLRGVLRRQGLLVTTAALGVMLADNASQAVPATVLSKLAAMGTTRTVAAMTTARAVAIKALLTTAALVGVIAGVGYLQRDRSAPSAQGPSGLAPVVREAIPQSRPARSSQNERAVVNESATPPTVVSDAHQVTFILPKGTTVALPDPGKEYEVADSRNDGTPEERAYAAESPPVLPTAGQGARESRRWASVTPSWPRDWDPRSLRDRLRRRSVMGGNEDFAFSDRWMRRTSVGRTPVFVRLGPEDRRDRPADAAP